MKVQILQENLNKGLIIASRLVSAKAQLPILSNILLKTDQGRLQVAATNLENGVSLWLGAKIEEEGEITVPAKVFSEIVTTLSAGTVDIKTNGNVMQILSGGYQASLNCVSALEYPKLPVPSEQSIVSISAGKLADGINQVAFSAAADETRPVLTGVLLKLKGKTLSMAATDGYRLSLKDVEIDKDIKEQMTLILPSKTLMEAARIINDEKIKADEIIQIGYTKEKNQVVFLFPQLHLFSRIIDGDFPDYEKIIPNNLLTKITINNEDFIQGVKLVSVFARDSSNIVKFDIKDNSLNMSANSPQVGENKISIESKIEGEDVEIAFNFRFLQSLLAIIKEKEITLDLNGPLSPGVFRIVGSENFLHLIMPVRLQTEEK